MIFFNIKMTHQFSIAERVYLGEVIANHIFIHPNGRFDLEAFCVVLSTCLRYDGIEDGEPERAGAIHRLLVEVMSERFSNDEMRLYYQRINVPGWTSEQRYIYFDGKRTAIHISALVLVGHLWIASIGSDILKVPEKNWGRGYFGWVSEEWHFSHTFMSRYHNELFTFLKKFDAEISKKGGVSSFETLHRSLKYGIKEAQAREEIAKRDRVWVDVIHRISRAIEAGFNLEAISLSENVMHNLLFNFLSSERKIKAGATFNALIKQVLDLHEGSATDALLHDVDAWRLTRNAAVHGFVESSIAELSSNEEGLDETLAKTASVGMSLVERLIDWYREQAANFVPHNFPRTKLSS